MRTPPGAFRHVAPWSPLQPGDVLDGRYAIEERVAVGGMAAVYRAVDRTTSAPVAIKMLLGTLTRDGDAIARLTREAELARQFDHPNICPILALGGTGPATYLVMPFLEGETLAAREERIGRFEVTEAIAVLGQLTEGLQHAHDLGILHRDLKPENVVLVPESDGGERAVVMDFGLAKANETSGALARITSTGIVLGTPEFMSPEQIRGLPLDARSDIYALGVLAFEMLTGELPFVGDTAQDLMMNHLTGLPRRLTDLRPELPVPLESVLLRALATSPRNRFPDMRTFGLALRTSADPVAS